MKTGWAHQVSLDELVVSCQRGDWQGLRGLDLAGARLALREILTPADLAPILAEVELRARLATLAATMPVRGPR